MAAHPSARAPGLRWRAPSMMLLRAFARRLGVGELTLVLPDGERHRFRGRAAGPQAELRVRRARTLRRLLTGGLIGLMEAYLDGDWDSPDLATFLELGARNEAHFGEILEGSSWGRWLHRLGHLRRANSRRGSRRNIAAHYDLGNDFYRLWLDPEMTYSGALFADQEESLEAAQRRKYDRLLDSLALGPDDHLLEVGCGWGGFAVYAAQRTGCRVTGITLSREQLGQARERAARAGVSERVRFRLQDYRDVAERYDAVASIEMFEAVGEAYWPAFFSSLKASLEPGGRAALQVITIDEGVFESYRRGADFIQRYVFPGGMLPSPSAFAEAAETAGLGIEARSFHGASYERTLADWSARFERAQAQVRGLGFDERFVRLWRAYLAYCRAGFRTGRIDLMHARLCGP